MRALGRAAATRGVLLGEPGFDAALDRVTETLEISR